MTPSLSESPFFGDVPIIICALTVAELAHGIHSMILDPTAGRLSASMLHDNQLLLEDEILRDHRSHAAGS